MRNRTNYNYTPAASSSAVHRRPAPRRPRTNWNQLLLLLFFIVLPVLALLALFASGIKWVFAIAALLTLVLMWMQHGFVLRGRVIMTTLYGILTVVMLSSALTPNTAPVNRPYGTIAPITAPTPTASLAMNSQVANLLMSQGSGETGTAGTVGAQGAAGQPIGSGGAPSDNAPVVSNPGTVGTSAAEAALDQFLRCWQLGVMDDLVQYTPPSWQEANSPAKQKLFYKFYTKQLQGWEVQGTPSGTDADSSRTVSVIIDILYNGREERTLACDALMIKESNSWYVDPDSLANGTAVENVTPQPDVQQETPLPYETPEPTKAPTSKTKLYYNANGGSYYHIDSKCTSVNEKYFPLKSFIYGNLDESPYNKLKACPTCHAPERP